MCAANGAGDGQHMRQVGAAVFVRGRAHGDEQQRCVGDSRFGIGGELQAAGLTIGCDDFVQARFEDRNLARFQPRDLGSVDIDADDIVADLGKTGAGHQADIARAENRDSHGFPKASGRRESTLRERAIVVAARAQGHV